MSQEPEVWTVQGFLDYFLTIHRDMEDRTFAFILGAGASKASGIPTGAELVDRWLKELHVRLDPQQDKRNMESWATEQTLGINGFDLTRAASFYPEVYERRFGSDPEEGYAELETTMAGKDPSFGYSVLANLLAVTRHQVVITTNFDDLVADALFIYTGKRPLVCGHESLAEFIRPRMRRPVIAKLHRDLLLAPRNSPTETSHLDQRWGNALHVLFRSSSPIFIGYGGNDGSLMGLLEKLDPAQTVGRAAWCYYAKGPPPDDRIRAVVGRLRGFLVPIPGFDELMLLLGNELGFPLLADSIKIRANERAEKYQKSVETIQSGLAVTEVPGTEQTEVGSDLRRALESTIDRAEDPSSLRLKARGTDDLGQKEQIYREALTRFPKDPYLLGDFAEFLDRKGDNDEAEQLYRKAVEENPDNHLAMINLAKFLSRVRKRQEEAEHLYRRAADVDKGSFSMVRLANFLSNAKRDYDSAEDLYKRAIALQPADTHAIWNYSQFLEEVRKDYDGAEKLLNLAIATSRKSFNLWNLGRFLHRIRHDFDGAEALYREALTMEPNDVSYMRDLAVLLEEQKRYDVAEGLYQRAVELKPNDSAALIRLARFLANVRKRYDEAKKMYRRVIEIEPNNGEATSALSALEKQTGEDGI